MQDNRDLSRFEHVTEQGVVFADYRRTDSHVLITHVEAPRHLRGMGLAAKLMREIAEHARESGMKLRPLCGYAATWFRRHKSFADVLD